MSTCACFGCVTVLTCPAGKCREVGAPVFFDSDLATFEAVAAQGPAALQTALSATKYPDGASVTQERIFAGTQKDSNGTIRNVRMAYYVRAPQSSTLQIPPASRTCPPLVLTQYLAQSMASHTYAQLRRHHVPPPPPS